MITSYEELREVLGKRVDGKSMDVLDQVWRDAKNNVRKRMSEPMRFDTGRSDVVLLASVMGVYVPIMNDKSSEILWHQIVFNFIIKF